LGTAIDRRLLEVKAAFAPFGEVRLEGNGRFWNPRCKVANPETAPLLEKRVSGCAWLGANRREGRRVWNIGADPALRGKLSRYNQR